MGDDRMGHHAGPQAGRMAEGEPQAAVPTCHTGNQFTLREGWTILERAESTVEEQNPFGRLY
jgi:hypothetical protein